jgi:hypothetical protein
MKIDEKNGKPEMYENGSVKGKVDSSFLEDNLS